MIRISEVVLDISEEKDRLLEKIAKRLAICQEDILSWRIDRESVDARKKNEIKLVYTVDIAVNDRLEKKLLARFPLLRQTEDEGYQAACPGMAEMLGRPVVAGFGPCGIFAALTLAEAGYRPVVLERGCAVEERVADVNRFWEDGNLLEESNVLFGEGGAGAFSDGKLTTQIKDRRIGHVLRALVAAGAPQEILYKQKPHIGTDLLRETVKNIRRKIIALGGEVHFGCRLTGIETDGCGGLTAVTYCKGADNLKLETNALILAVGHSARDTIETLYQAGLFMEQKPFSIGVRIEHRQAVIDKAQFGEYAGDPRLGTAEYKLSHRCGNGRGIYTFCMCPGGQVIASASEPGGLVTNGMSYHDRAGQNANSALLVDVRKEDFESGHPLAGIAFQRKWEKEAFLLGGADYAAPVQRLGGFMAGEDTKEDCTVLSPKMAEEEDISIFPTYRPGVKWTKIDRCLPDFAAEALREAIPAFGRKLKGFHDPDAVLTAIESRSSSPVRIRRDETMQGSVTGIYPAGEGAGYAGGITSAAVDGIRAAERIITRFALPPANMVQ